MSDAAQHDQERLRMESNYACACDGNVALTERPTLRSSRQRVRRLRGEHGCVHSFISGRAEFLLPAINELTCRG